MVSSSKASWIRQGSASMLGLSFHSMGNNDQDDLTDMKVNEGKDLHSVDKEEKAETFISFARHGMSLLNMPEPERQNAQRSRWHWTCHRRRDDEFGKALKSIWGWIISKTPLTRSGRSSETTPIIGPRLSEKINDSWILGSSCCRYSCHLWVRRARYSYHYVYGTSVC